MGNTKYNNKQKEKLARVIKLIGDIDFDELDDKDLFDLKEILRKMEFE